MFHIPPLPAMRLLLLSIQKPSIANPLRKFKISTGYIPETSYIIAHYENSQFFNDIDGAAVHRQSPPCAGMGRT
ncbi:MAG: hypothetical protein ACR2PY_04515, partial [Salinispira sp.]